MTSRQQVEKHLDVCWGAVSEVLRVASESEDLTVLEFLPPADKASRGAADTDALRRRPLAQEERGVIVAEAPEQVFPVVAPAATATSPAHPTQTDPVQVPSASFTPVKRRKKNFHRERGTASLTEAAPAFDGVDGRWSLESR